MYNIIMNANENMENGFEIQTMETIEQKSI